MSPSLPPLLHPLSSGWADLGTLPPAPAAAEVGIAHDWFGTPASGRVLSANPNAGPGRNVQGWTDAVLHPLLADPGTP